MHHLYDVVGFEILLKIGTNQKQKHSNTSRQANKQADKQDRPTTKQTYIDTRQLQYVYKSDLNHLSTTVVHELENGKIKGRADKEKGMKQKHSLHQHVIVSKHPLHNNVGNSSESEPEYWLVVCLDE